MTISSSFPQLLAAALWRHPLATSRPPRPPAHHLLPTGLPPGLTGSQQSVPPVRQAHPRNQTVPRSLETVGRWHLFLPLGKGSEPSLCRELGRIQSLWNQTGCLCPAVVCWIFFTWSQQQHGGIQLLKDCKELVAWASIRGGNQCTISGCNK